MNLLVMKDKSGSAGSARIGSIICFSISLASIFFSLAIAHSNYTGFSGAPGSNGTCTSSCHRQYDFEPSVTISGFPEIYEPELQYTIYMNHTAGSSINQFNASVRIGGGTENAGTITAGESTLVYNNANETNGVCWQLANTDSGTFIWTAPPAGSGSVTLYWAGLQGNRTTGADTQVVLIATETPSEVEYLPGTPSRFTLSQNYPNPFNDQTIVEFEIAEQGPVQFVITNVLGQIVYQWDQVNSRPGMVSVRWGGMRADGGELPTGIYFYRLISPAGTITKKMMLLR